MTPADDVFARFLVSRVALNCAETTIVWYRYQLRLYGNWLSANTYTFDAVKLIHLQEFQASLRGKYAPSTVHQATTAVITFYRWALEVELITTDPTVKLKRPKVPDYIPPAVAREYVLHMIDSIRPASWIDHRDKLIIRVLFCTGMRVSECAGLLLSDVRLDDRHFVVHGKGSKFRFAPFGDDLVLPLWTWIHVQRPVYNTSALFLASHSNGGVRGSITDQTIYFLLRKRAETAVLEWKSPHAYRHGFAIDMLKNGASTRLVQKLLGHARIETTEKYLTMMPDLVQGMFDEIWKELD